MRFPAIRSLSALFLILFVTTSCQKGEEAVSHDPSGARLRRVELEGQSNCRDIGGYATEDGRTVKWGQVYRCGELTRLSDGDLEVIEDIGICKVASFLTDAEIEARGADRLPEGVSDEHMPIESGNAEELAALVLEARRTGDFSKIPPDFNTDIHRLLVTEGREAYAAALREISDPANRPYIYHCSHGVHRTGTMTAVLLGILGVPWETVREEYLLSNKYRSAEIERRLEELRKAAAITLDIAESEVDMTNARAFYILQGSYIDASHDEIMKEYGSFNSYAREGLGLTDKEIMKLQSELLE